MQIFILGTPYYTATVLDRRRLNKQIVECNQIVKAIKGESSAWGKHPVVKMYTSHLDYLKHYTSCLQNYRDGNYELAMTESRKAELVRPSFVNSTLTNNMKRRLFTKDERFYSQFSEYGKSDINLYFVDGKYAAYQNGKKIEKIFGGSKIMYYLCVEF